MYVPIITCRVCDVYMTRSIVMGSASHVGESLFLSFHVLSGGSTNMCLNTSCIARANVRSSDDQ